MTVDNVKALAEETRKTEYCSLFCQGEDCKGFGKCPVHGSEWCEDEVYAQGFVDGFFKFWSMWEKFRADSKEMGEKIHAFREKLENKYNK